MEQDQTPHTSQSQQSGMHIRILLLGAALLGLGVGAFWFAIEHARVDAAPLENKRANTVQLLAGQYSGNGTTGQDSDTNQTLPSSTFRLAETDVDIRDAFVVIEAQLGAYADTGNITGHQLAFDACVAPCTTNPWSGSGRVLQDASNTILTYADVTGGPHVRLLIDVTSETQLAAYTGQTSTLAYQVGYRFNHGGTATNTIAGVKAKLYVTYEHDAYTAELTKTVVYPLESTAAGDTGSRQSSQDSDCTLDTNCPTFNYNIQIPELTNSSTQRQQAWFEIGGYNDGNGSADITRNINIEGADISTSNFILESEQGGAQGNWSEGWWEVDGLEENSAQELEHYFLNSTQFAIGGEVFDTYIASSSAVTSTKTVSFPIGVVTLGSVTTRESGATTVYLPEETVDIQKAWLRVNVAGYDVNANETISIATEVGVNPSSSDAAYLFNAPNVNPTEAIYIIHVISSTEYAELETASATSGVPFTVYTLASSAFFRGVSAELMITYTYTDDTTGYLSSLMLFGGQTATAGNDSSETVTTAASAFPESSGTKTLRGAVVRASYNISDSDNTMPNGVALSGAVLAQSGPSCSNTFNGDTDALPAFFEFDSDASGAFTTIDSVSYEICLSTNGGGDVSAGGKMNAMLVYTYQTDLPRYDQSAFRWFDSAASTSVESPLADTNASATAPVPSTPFRLRMLIHIDSGLLATSSEIFKLQYATSTAGGCDTGFSGETYTDVSTSTGVIQFYDISGVTDAEALTTTLTDPTHGTHTIRAQAVEEENTFTNNQGGIDVGEDGLWDFALTTVDAPPETTYCFRAVLADNSLLNTYSVVPEIRTRDTVFTQQDYRFYENLDALQPVTPLAAENTPVSGIENGAQVRLRMNVGISNQALPTSSARWRLQYGERGSTSTCSDLQDIDFANIGALASTTEPWRGYDNSAPTSGISISAVVLSTSSIRETYEETGRSTLNVRGINIGQTAEWDWVLENYSAISSANYCFRMANDDSTALDVYANLPEITVPGAASWRAAEDTPTTTKKNTNVRVRVQVSNEGTASQSPRFELQYSLATSGPWTTMPADPACSTAVVDFRICSSNYYIDLDPTTAQLTPEASSFIAGLMVESTAPTPTTTLAIDEYTEFEWNIQATDSATETIPYYLRLTDAGTPLGLYSVYPEITVEVATSTYAQSRYRWYANVDAVDPTDPWPVGITDISENVPISGNNQPTVQGDVLRLRTVVIIGEQALPTSTASFDLEYGTRASTSTCSSVSVWTDVGALASSTPWRFFNNTTTAGGTTITTITITTADIFGTYEEANPSSLNPISANFNEGIEYDWVITDNDAPGGTSYCFRMTHDNGTPLNTYTYYPEILLPEYNPKSQNWRWYDDETNETPTSPLAAENVAPTNIADQDIVKLRITIDDTANATGTDAKFQLQYSRYSDFQDETSNVVEIGSCTASSTWCYADGVDNDNDAITTRVLGDSTVNGTHNESGVSTTTFDAPRNIATEYEFTIQNRGARTGNVYYFRPIHTNTGEPVALAGGESYPSVLTEAGALTFSISGVNSGITVENIVTDATTTATAVPFGSLTLATSSETAQQLSVTTNAIEGYQIFVIQDSNLQNSHATAIAAVSSTNASPQGWSAACNTTSSSCYGYHTSDGVLEGGSTRFAASDTYARFETAAQEVAWSSVPVTTETTDIVYRLYVPSAQNPGAYSHNVAYIVIPIF